MSKPDDERRCVEPFLHSPRNAWLEMLRPPNLFTVPGDPLAGYLLVSAAVGPVAGVEIWRLVLAAVASLLLYAGGLLQNDYFDRAEDRVQRPSRPLPSGRADPRVVVTTAFMLGIAGVVAAFAASPTSGLVAAALMACMSAYNAGGKRVQLVGPVLMGACRGSSLLVGAGLWGRHALESPAVAISALGLLLLVASITVIASRETEAVRLGLRRWLPALVLAVWLAAVFAWLPWPAEGAGWMAMGLSAWAVAWMLYCGHLLEGRPAPALVQSTVGRCIGGLLFVQAALAAHQQPLGLVIAAALLLAWPLSRRAGEWFYAS